MREEIREISREAFFDEPLSRHTSIRIGGPADALLYPATVEETTGLVGYARRKKIPYFLMGSGSNLLVRDKGIRGIVISLVRGFGTLRREGESILFAEGGVGLPRLVEFTAEEGLSGLECLAGIPGNIGGALTMNAGTPEGAIGDAVESVTLIDREGRVQTWPRERAGFAYRESRFPPGSVLIACRLKVTPSTKEKVRERIRKSLQKRVETQPLNVPNLGSVFKNPSSEQGSSGQLIEKVGLKGKRIGGAMISERHANFIVNVDSARATDVQELIHLAQERVVENFGVSLEPEIRIIESPERLIENKL